MLTVYSLGDTIHERLGNPCFAGKFADLVRKGELLPDEEVCTLYEKTFSSDGKPVAVNNGFFRTTGQISWGADHGLLETTSTTVVFDAVKSTCWVRAIAKAKNKPAARHIREDEFDRAFKRHQKSLDLLVRSLMKTGTRVVRINADRPIVTEVFLDVAAHVKVAFDKGDAHKHAASIHCQPSIPATAYAARL
jgi:hypothetical protein